MSQADLARRLRVSGAAIAKLERAEADGRITLAKPNEVARRSTCTVVCALEGADADRCPSLLAFARS